MPIIIAASSKPITSKDAKTAEENPESPWEDPEEDSEGDRGEDSGEDSGEDLFSSCLSR